jgi:pimeloyl-ACP methyl ester carboxylesterase
MKKTNTLVLIHGLFVNNTSWAEWKLYFEAQGFTVHTPANPGHAGNPADLRKNIDPKLNKVTLEDVVMNIANFIDTLPEKPIVVGHSLAGFVVQKLIEMDKAVAGISINGAPPKNVLPPFQTIKTVFPVVNFLKSGPYMGSREWYHYAFFNNLSRAESDREFDKIAVPESRTIARDTLLKSFANIDFKKPHNPLLFIGGENDHIFPAGFTRRIAGRYKDKNSIVDVKTFEGRSHYIAAEQGWEEVAGYVLNWIRERAV